MAVAFATAASSAASCASSSASSFCSCALVAESPSISTRRPSACCVLLLRVCAFVASSWSHQPLCSVSAVACDMRRVRSSSMSFLTLAKGSPRARSATAESARLPRRRDSLLRYSEARCWLGASLAARSCTSAAARRGCSSRLGRCFAAVPATSSLERSSLACSRAWISSERSAWRLWNSCSRCSQLAVRSWRYAASSACVAASSWRSAAAATESSLCLTRPACLLAFAASAAWAAVWRLCASRVKAWRRCCSSVCSSVSSCRNLSFSCSSISRMPPELNS
mmetsp:Transcript_102585/g.331015  ORF Transcript_102585/g.331015 Transcript_102585/m.331015 type:complete len:281 (-) Transcript_102585:578-1420(-)